MFLINHQIKKISTPIFFSTLVFFTCIQFAYADIESSVNNWTKAWSSQKVDLYLDSYAEQFTPPKGKSRKAWESERKIRLLTPSYIKVVLSDLKINQYEENYADVEFTQNYQSDTYTDEVKKRLSMQKVDEQWLIVKEKVIATNNTETENLITQKKAPDTVSRDIKENVVSIEKEVIPVNETIEEALNHWSNVWSAQNIDAYLAAYAESFVPPKKLSRRKWEKQRHKRILSPRFIKVTLTDTKIKIHGEDYADVEFKQNYQSDNYSDDVRKLISMQRIEDQWLIAQEKTLEAKIQEETPDIRTQKKDSILLEEEQYLVVELETTEESALDSAEAVSTEEREGENTKEESTYENTKLNESSSRYSDEMITLKEQQDLPQRPEPFFELWQDYVNQGPYAYEFELPTGMVVSPGLLLFGNLNTGLEVTDDGVNDVDSAWVTTMDLFLNLTLSGTERILVGVSPLTRENGAKSEYSFSPGDNGYINNHNVRLTTAFFEGELSEMFPKLDMDGRLPLDYEIAFGRQPVIVQGGMLINDTMDSFAVTRSTIPFSGTNFARIGGFFAFGNIDRSNNVDDDRAELYGIFSAIDVAHSTFEIDATYIDTTDTNSDQVNFGVSMLRPFILFEHDVDTQFRFLHSYTPDNENAHATDGTLLYTSFSFAPKRTDNILYLNAFKAFGDYATAARSAGGPLSITGLLFTSNGLAGAPINNFASDAFGGSLGYQMFFSPALRRNLIFEVGGKIDNSSSTVNRYGGAVRYSHALGQHVFFEVGGFIVEQESTGDPAYGIRTKINFIF